jgi:hypothetical protein
VTELTLRWSSRRPHPRALETLPRIEVNLSTMSVMRYRGRLGCRSCVRGSAPKRPTSTDQSTARSLRATHDLTEGRTLAPATGSRQNRLHTRLDAISVGLRAVRLVDATRRWRLRVRLTDTDIAAIKSASADLRNEISVLQNENAPDATDETAFAFASLALQAMPTPASQNYPASPVQQLESLASDLDAMLSGQAPDEAIANRIETTYKRTSDLVQSNFGRTGELFEENDEIDRLF